MHGNSVPTSQRTHSFSVRKACQLVLCERKRSSGFENNVKRINTQYKKCRDFKCYGGWYIYLPFSSELLVLTSLIVSREIISLLDRVKK